MFVGLMSGTSMDGVDFVLAEFRRRRCRIIKAGTSRYPAALARRLVRTVTAPDSVSLKDLGQLDVAIARAFARAVQQSLPRGIDVTSIRAVGSHGQTVFHQPSGRDRFSMQLGDPATIAEITGIPVVADFRQADMALGGQGAPLAPAFHQWIFSRPGRSRAVVNIGGIANITVLPDKSAPSGFDTGPGNTLLDAWHEKHRDRPFDRQGRWAAGGRVIGALLADMGRDPYFRKRPPKSTGREYFNLDWLNTYMKTLGKKPKPVDVQATLAQLTAQQIARAVSKAQASEVALCGGGVHNDDLVSRIRALLGSVPVVDTGAWGVNPDWVEAAAFAWLARARIRREPGNIPETTGARAAALLGGLYLPSNHLM